MFPGKPRVHASSQSRFSTCTSGLLYQRLIMADYVFILRTRVGRAIFTLKPEVLEISQKLLGQMHTVTIPLTSISPDYERVAWRLPLWRLWPGAVMILVGFGGYYVLLRQEVVPREFAMYPAALGVPALWGVARLLRRFDCFVFRDHWKRELFVVAREEEQVQECEAFLHALLDRLESETPGVIAAPEEPVFTRPQDKWKISLAAGIGAAALPWLNRIEPELTFYTAALVLGATTIALMTGVGAIIARERQRYWALAGMALSLLPYVAY
jgi:hypothetical protein